MSPAEHMAATLAAAKLATPPLSFELAWQRGWSAIPWANYRPPVSEDWRHALRETRSEWERAYRDEPTPNAGAYRRLGRFLASGDTLREAA